jgi:hypothetical protein
MTDEFFSCSVSGEILHELVPDKTAEQWALWLRNSRNQSRRVHYRIPFVRMAGGVFYDPEELRKFADWENNRRLGKIKLTGRAAEVMRAFGIGEATGGATGRQWKGASADRKDGVIQFVIADPLLVFAMTPEQALDLSCELKKAANNE